MVNMLVGLRPYSLSMHATALDISTDSRGLSQVRSRKTRVVIVSDHPIESRDVAKNLRSLDLDVQLCLFDGQTLTSIPTRIPDAVLCHLVDYAEQGPKLAKVIRAHYKTRNVPIIGAMSRPSPDASVGFDSTLFAPMHPSQIANRVNAMIRLGVMDGEISRRLHTLGEDFGQTPDIGDLSPDRKFRVLFIGKASPSFMVIINALQDKGVEITAAFTSFSAFDYLHGAPFDAVVMNALDQTEPAFSISETMRRNSRLYHTPTLFLVNGHSFTEYKAAYDRGAQDIIDCDADSEEISGRILELANYHRIHEQMKSDFLSLSVDAAVDPSGTAYSQRFMRAHLPRIMDAAALANAPVTLIGLKLTSSSVDDVTEKALNSAYAQTAELINNLVRMQDVVCRWDEDTFVLAFYNTDASEANTILTRITALLDCTVYDSGDFEGAPLSISAQTVISEINTTSNPSGNPLDKLISHLIQNPDEN